MRSVLGVITGYVVMTVVVFATFTALYLVLGVERSFAPGTWDVTALWMVGSVVLAFVAAVAGGWACLAITKSVRAAQVLVGLVVVLGLAFAVPTLTTPVTPNERRADATIIEAMQRARTPRWIVLLNPWIGAAGVLVAARLQRVSASPRK